MANSNRIEIVSFDVEGTLVTTDFSAAIWFEGIPGDYAARYGLTLAEAEKIVYDEYARIGDQNMEWYDINYWMKKFDLGSPDKFLARYRDRIHLYPEVVDVLQSLGEKFKLIVASGTPREFLAHLLKDIEHHFSMIFSSTSDFKSTKNPDFYFGICRQMNSSAPAIVHVGDNLQFDFHSAARAGLLAYYLDRKDEQKEGQCGMKSLTELKDLLLNNPY
ncbi:MAG TPA: HAD family hydrolase [Dehalococcoidia bacterium]|nr:HAD family hydrolase [Dehalococcoidia bacterium]